MKTRRNPNDFVKLLLYGAIAIAGIKLMKDYQSAAPPEGGVAGQGQGLIADIGKWLFGTPEPEIDPVTGQPKVDPVTGKPVVRVGTTSFRLGEGNITWNQAANTLGGTVRVGHKGKGGLFSIILIPQSRDWLGVRTDRTPPIEFNTQYGDDADWYETVVDIPHTHIDEWYGAMGYYCAGCDLVSRVVVRDDQTNAYGESQNYDKPTAV